MGLRKEFLCLHLPDAVAGGNVLPCAHVVGAESRLSWLIRESSLFDCGNRISTSMRIEVEGSGGECDIVSTRW